MLLIYICYIYIYFYVVLKNPQTQNKYSKISAFKGHNKLSSLTRTNTLFISI